MGAITDTIQQAGQQITRLFYDDSLLLDFENTFALKSQAGNTASGTARKIGASSGYQVPTGTKLVVVGVQASSDTGTWTSGENQWATYTDNDLGINGLGAQTNPKLLGTFVDPGSAAGLRHFQSVHWEVPAGKYLTSAHNLSGGTAFVIFFCRLENA